LKIKLNEIFIAQLQLQVQIDEKIYW